MKFLCGEFYEEINSSYTEAIERNDRFSVLFSEYINFTYDNKDSAITIWNLYKGNVLSIEKILDKYVWEFNAEELKDLMASIASDSFAIKKSVRYMLEQYIDWIVGYKKLISINLMNSINKDEVIKLNKNALQKKLWGMNAFWDLIKSMSYKVDNQFLLSLVLARYGVLSLEYQLQIKYEYINKEDKTLLVIDGDEVITTLNVDDRFINFCEKANSEEGYIGEYLIKNSLRQNKISTTKAVIQLRTIRACEKSNINNLRVNDMFKSCYLDKILEIRKERHLNTSDFLNTTLYFNPHSSNARYFNLLKFYEALSDDKVEKGNKMIEDSKGLDFVMDLKKKIGFF